MARHNCKVGRSYRLPTTGSHAPRAGANADPFTLSGQQQPNYDAGGQGRRLKIFRPPTSGPNFSVQHDVPVIRSRVRDRARNDPWEGAALDKLDSNGIGTGIQAKMVNGTEAQKLEVKQLYNRWLKECDADGVLDGYGQQLVAWREWNEVGEVFGRLRYRRPSDGLSVPLQVQIIEAEQCPNDLYTIASNGNQVRAGIEFNAIGQRVAYWMYREHPGDPQNGNRGRERVRVPADQIIHLYRPLRAGQIRGIPDQASVLVRMFNLDKMNDAVLDRQKIANLFGGFFKHSIDPENPPPNMVDELTGAADGEGEEDYDGTPVAGLEPGTMVELPPGMEAQFSQPPAPGSDYAEFVRGHLLAIAARRGVPYEVMTGDLREVSDRALRLILNEFRRFIEMRQWLFFIPQWCQRIRTAMLDTARLAGALPSLTDYENRRDEYVETLWVPQGWPYSHPVQDVTADIKAIRAGLDSKTAVVLRNGDDPEEIDAQIAADNERADRLGLAFDSDGRKLSSAGLTQARPAGTALPSPDVRRQDDDRNPNEDDEDDDTEAK